MATSTQRVSAAASFVDVLAQLLNMRQQTAQYKGAAAASEYNAAVNRQRAEVSRAISGQREEQVRRSSREALGRQAAASAESGLGLGGSNADLERQSAVMAELDALNIRYEGELEAHGYLSEAALEDYNARINRSYGRNARVAGFIGAGGTALAGYGDYYRAGQAKRESSKVKVS